MEKNRYLTAGEFAHIEGVTKHTLFHYDKIGLFSPEYRGANGYRYYTISQLDIFDVIYTLKDLGMSLEEIKEYLSEKTPESLLLLLEKEEHIIQKRMKELQQSARWITDKKKQIRSAMELDVNALYVKEESEQYYVLHSPKSPDEKTLAIDEGKLLDECAEKGVKPVHGLGYQQNVEKLIQGIYNYYIGIYIPIDKKMKGLNCQVRPAGAYLTAYHKGNWESLGKTYEKMFQYAQENHLKPMGVSWEDYILDGMTQKYEKDYVIRVQFPCEKIQ